jgi:hypothetical protein
MESCRCHKCGALIEFDRRRQATAAVVDHYVAAHGLGGRQ